jgi:hypothetical protein
MQWFYANGDNPQGPVSEEEFQALVKTGAIKPDTLVWHEGLPQWTAHGTLANPSLPPPPPLLPPVANGVQCVECHQSFPPEEVIQLEGMHVCARCKPVFVQKMREGVQYLSPSLRLWRKGKVLVMARDAELPDRCVKCNSPADGFRLKRKLNWHPSWVILMLCVNLIVYLIVALVTSRKATIEIGLCSYHRSARTRNLWLAWGGVGSMVLATVGAIAFDSGWPMLLALVSLISTIVFGLLAKQVSPAFIDKDFVHLNGVKPAFLESLPEWRGP